MAETTTTADVLEGVDLAGRRVIVTGASAGIGVETTRSLAACGAAVTMAVRDLTKAATAIEAMRTATPGVELDLEVRELDLASLASVRAFATGWLADHDRLDILIDNAGIMACPESRTADGFEMQLGTNHLGHFVLTNLLAPALVAAAPSRVVVLSSSGHKLSDVDLDDPFFERTPYDPWDAYGRAKTANSLFAVAFDARYRDLGVRAYAVHPGFILTELGRHMGPDELEALQARRPLGTIYRKSIEEGAATSVWAATAAELDGVGGVFCENTQIAEPVDEPGTVTGVMRHALDAEKAEQLWTLSERLVDQVFPVHAP